MSEDDAAEEIKRLRALLQSIVDCVDPKCGSLCGRCINALIARAPQVEKPVPQVADDDPIRVYRHSEEARA